MTNRRVVYTVRPGRLGGWDVFQRGLKRPRWKFLRKVDAVDFVANECRILWNVRGQKAQMIVCGKNGYQYERTYPDDTPRRKG